MRNIPVFTAENGLASLILREIPYSGRAYVLIRAIWHDCAAALLQECAQFCRAVGATEIFASDGEAELPAAHAYDMLQLVCLPGDLPQLVQPVELVPVCEENGDRYLEIYNRCFQLLPGAAAYRQEDVLRLQTEGRGFLARTEGGYGGVIELGDRTLEGIAVLPEHRGLGYPMALTALQRFRGQQIRLKVADNNHNARALYERLGFREEKRISRWWLVE